MAKLSEFCKINMGQSPDSSSYNELGNGMPFYQGNADFGEIHPKVRVWCGVPTKIAHPNDILISVRAPIGALNIADVECCIGRGLAALTADLEKCHQKYLWYALESKVDELNSKGTGSTFKAIGKSVLCDTEIPLPSISEQKEISDILDKVATLIDARKDQLTALETLVKSRFIELFGDPETNPKGYKTVLLSDIAEYYNGLTYSPDNVSENGTIVLRSSNIQNSQLDFEDTVRVDCPVKEKMFVKENDILMCSRNGSARLVGKVALIKNLSEPMSFGAFMMIIRSKYYSYLMTYFQMDAFRRQIKTGATTTINQITGNMLNKISLLLPEMSDVTQFAEFVEQTDKLKFEVKEALNKLETLKKSLMQQYFG